jgi:hypothetical protein
MVAGTNDGERSGASAVETEIGKSKKRWACTAVCSTLVQHDMEQETILLMP